MKIKKIMRSIKKVPLLCLISITIVLSDGIYDGILPWPSPFHITPAHAKNAVVIGDERDTVVMADNEDTVVMADAGNAADDADAGNAADMADAGNAADMTDTGADHADADTRIDHADAGVSAGDANTPSENGNSNSDGSGEPLSADSENDSPQRADSVSAYDGPDPSAETDADAPDPTQTALGEDGLPLIEYMQVEDDYFDDAVFIGDSRTRSLQLYAGLEHTTFLADTGLTIYTVLDKKLTPSTMTTKTTVTDYLTNHQFNKIYLMLGINEVGTGTAESFCRSYGEVIETLRELQPDAIIYLQAILHISESKDKEHTYINNAAIIERNEALQSLTDNVHVFWLDCNPAVCDENGYLFDSYTFDGVHLQAKYVYLWTDYLKQHAIRQDEPFVPLAIPAEPHAMP